MNMNMNNQNEQQQSYGHGQHQHRCYGTSAHDGKEVGNTCFPSDLFPTSSGAPSSAFLQHLDDFPFLLAAADEHDSTAAIAATATQPPSLSGWPLSPPSSSAEALPVGESKHSAGNAQYAFKTEQRRSSPPPAPAPSAIITEDRTLSNALLFDLEPLPIEPTRINIVPKFSVEDGLHENRLWPSSMPRPNSSNILEGPSDDADALLEVLRPPAPRSGNNFASAAATVAAAASAAALPISQPKKRKAARLVPSCDLYLQEHKKRRRGKASAVGGSEKKASASSATSKMLIQQPHDDRRGRLPDKDEHDRREEQDHDGIQLVSFPRWQAPFISDHQDDSQDWLRPSSFSNFNGERENGSTDEHARHHDVGNFPQAQSTVAPAPTSSRSRKSKNSSHIRSYQEAQWRDRFNELCIFKEKHGHCAVPYTFKVFPQLAQWVKRQRYGYKTKTEGKHSTLTDERQRILDSVGFVWDSHHALWEERYQELVEFYNKHGHCTVGVRSGCHNKPLAVWIKCQRRQRRLMMKGCPSNITEGRIERLDALNFCWDPRNIEQQNGSRKS